MVGSDALQHEDLIMNYFEVKKQFSSGVVEGLNRKSI